MLLTQGARHGRRPLRLLAHYVLVRTASALPGGSCAAFGPGRFGRGRRSGGGRRGGWRPARGGLRPLRGGTTFFRPLGWGRGEFCLPWRSRTKSAGWGSANSQREGETQVESM